VTKIGDAAAGVVCMHSGTVSNSISGHVYISVTSSLTVNYCNTTVETTLSALTAVADIM